MGVRPDTQGLMSISSFGLFLLLLLNPDKLYGPRATLLIHFFLKSGRKLSDLTGVGRKSLVLVTPVRGQGRSQVLMRTRRSKGRKQGRQGVKISTQSWGGVVQYYLPRSTTPDPLGPYVRRSNGYLKYVKFQDTEHWRIISQS